MSQLSRNPVLARLDALVGEWTVEPSVEGRSVGVGHTSFGWMNGADLLVQHADAATDAGEDVPQHANSPLPLTTVMGLDDTAERFTILYADSRRVSRVYEMTLEDGVWRIWRAAPGFHQRFEGTFSPDGATITAAWEMSEDGTTWTKDFDITYRRA